MVRRERGCAYCGARASQRDHVPPKAIFPANTGPLITVPACEDCHRGTSDDDEYFRDSLVMRHDVGGSSSGQQILNKALRALARPQQRGYARALARRTRLAQVQSEAGLLLGNAPVYIVENERLSRVVERTLRGLYYHEEGERLPEEGIARAWSLNGFQGASDSVLRELLKFSRACLASEPVTIAPSVFTYWIARTPEGKPGAWLLLFYERVPFLGLTVPQA